MAIPEGVLNSLVDTWAAARYVCVFTAAAGTTGANEATGGGYARAQTTFPTAAGGATTGSEVEISVAAGDYAEGGLSTAATGGTFRGSKPFTGGTVSVTGTGGSIRATPKILLTAAS